MSKSEDPAVRELAVDAIEASATARAVRPSWPASPASAASPEEEHFRAGALVTTNHIVFEVITLIRYRGGRDPSRAHELAERVGETLYSGKVARIHVATFEEEQAAFAYFKRHRDQKYSAVDCLSFVVMEKLFLSASSADASISRDLSRTLLCLYV